MNGRKAQRLANFRLIKIKGANKDPRRVEMYAAHIEKYGESEDSPPLPYHLAENEQELSQFEVAAT